MAETRKGFAFNNPDVAANGGWGAIITPDELRYVYNFGLPLTAPTGQVMTDETLQWYIDMAVKNVEMDLNFTMIKKQIRYRQPHLAPARTLPGVEEIDYEWEDPYDFDPEQFRKYIHIQLRRCPVISVQEVSFKNVIGQEITNITSWIKINHDYGTLEFYPSQGAFAAIPFFASPVFPNIAYQFAGEFPDAFFIDYIAGFNSAAILRKRYTELFNIVGILASINMMLDFGEGRSSALASSSVGLAGISESYSTTMSAENTLMGAKIVMLRKILHEFYASNRYKYGGLIFGAI